MSFKQKASRLKWITISTYINAFLYAIKNNKLFMTEWNVSSVFRKQRHIKANDTLPSLFQRFQIFQNFSLKP